MTLANAKIMQEPTPSLVHLASMIDAKETKLEKTTPPFLRRELVAELESLMRRFQVEYEQFLAATCQSPATN